MTDLNEVQNLATFESAKVIENGDAVLIELREIDGTLSEIQIGVSQLAD